VKNNDWVAVAERDAIHAKETRIPRAPSVHTIEPVPAAESPTYVGPKDNLSFRVYWWVFGLFFGSMKLIRWGQWWWSLPIRGWFLLTAICSRRVSDDVYIDRMNACQTCKANKIRVHPHRAPRSYCSLCQCPEWSLSQLKVKNRLAGWHCPKRRHDGPYPEDKWIAKLPESQREKFRMQFRDDASSGGGCKGCGKGGG